MVTASILKQRWISSDPVSIWSLATLFCCLAIIGPFVAILYVAAGDSGGLWSHLIETVFPRYVGNTLLLMAASPCLPLHSGSARPG